MIACRSLLLLALALPLSIAQGEETTDWSALAESAIEAFEPIDATRLEQARSELARHAMTLEQRVNPHSAFGAGWLDYLAWEGVQGQLTTGAEVDLAAASKSLAQFGTGAAGLEEPALQQAAAALEHYIAVASFVRVKNQPEVYAKQVARLANLMSQGDLGHAQDSFQVERRLALLSDVGQGEALLAAIRRSNNQPNLLLDFSSDLINRLVCRGVNDTGPVDDCILGTKIHGTGTTTGTLRVATRPSYNSARLRFTLDGTTHSRTRGVNGPVAIHSTGRTTFHVSKLVELSDNVFRTLPATASATTHTTTRGVNKIGGGFGSRLVETIAKKKVADKKPQSNAIAADHAEDRLEARLNEKLDSKIREARGKYDDNLTKPLRRRRITPRVVSHQSTDRALQILSVQATPKQLAAPGSAPSGVASASLNARLHQSAMNNLMAAYFGGATLRKETAQGEAELLGRVKPSWLKEEPTTAEPTPADDDFRPWAIDFRAGRPLSCVIESGSLLLTIHADQIRVGQEKYDRWDLTARFVPALVDGQWKLLREGPVDLLPTSFDPRAGKRLPSKQLALRSNLNKAVNEPEDRLLTEIDINAIDLSDRDLSIDTLGLEAIELTEGWISAAWRAY